MSPYQRAKMIKDYKSTYSAYAYTLSLSSATQMLNAYWWLITALREVVPS